MPFKFNPLTAQFDLVNSASTYARTATLVVAASDAKDTINADYICDGIDDDVQINAAITALPNSGGRVILSEGTFNIGASIVLTKSNTTLEGQKSSTLIKLENGKDVDVILVGDDINDYINFNVLNIQIDGNMNNQTTGMGVQSAGIHVLSKVKNVNIKDNIIKNTLASNIFLQLGSTTQTNILVEGNYLDTTKVGEFWSNIDETSNGSTVMNLIQNNFIFNGDLEGISSDAANILNNIVGAPQTISDNNICIDENAENSIINGNFVIVDNGGTGILAGGAYSTVSNNTINMAAGGKAAIFSSQTNITIIGNAIDCESTADDAVVIDIEGQGGTVVGNTLTIFGNSGNKIIGIFVGRVYTQVSSNTIVNQSSRDIAAIQMTKTQCDVNDNLIILGGVSGQNGIEITGKENNITDNYIETPGIGILLDGVLENLVSGNHIEAAAIVGITSSNTSINQTQIINNMISEFSTAGILLGCSTAGSTSFDNIVSNNLLIDCANESILLTNFSYSIVNANKIKNGGRQTNNTYDAIRVQSGGAGHSVYNNITNNNITSNVANKNRYGIREDSSDDGPNIITGNIALNAVTAQISTQNVSTIVANNLVT